MRQCYKTCSITRFIKPLQLKPLVVWYLRDPENSAVLQVGPRWSDFKRWQKAMCETVRSDSSWYLTVVWEEPVNCKWIYCAARVGSLIIFFKKLLFFLRIQSPFSPVCLSIRHHVPAKWILHRYLIHRNSLLYCTDSYLLLLLLLFPFKTWCGCFPCRQNLSM